MRQRDMARVVIVCIVMAVTGCGDGSSDGLSYVALGASDATGIGATPITNGYVYRIEQELEKQSGDAVALDNFGIPGAEVGDIDNLEVQLLKLGQPNLITLSTGANDIIDGDSVDGFDSDLNGLFGKLRSIAPDAEIVVANIPDLTKVERFIKNPDADVTSVRLAGYNAAIARQAAAHRARLVDLFSVPLDDSLISEGDGFHPNDRGHQIIAEEFMKVITPLIPELKRAAD